MSRKAARGRGEGMVSGSSSQRARVPFRIGKGRRRDSGRAGNRYQHELARWWRTRRSAMAESSGCRIGEGVG